MTFIRHIFSIVCSLVLLIVGSLFAQAATSDWQDLGGGKARVHAVVNPANDRIEGAVEITLLPGWTTYWRYPGSSGIPPHFDFTGSTALGPVEVQYPAPKKIGEGERSYAGYKSAVMFPFSAPLVGDKNPELKISILVGVCEEICIPARAEFEIPKAELLQSDLVAMRALNLARLKIPKLKNPTELNIAKSRISDKFLEIEIYDANGFENADLFVEGPNEWHLLPPERSTTDNGRLVFKLDISDVPQEVDILEKQLRYTLSNGTTGIEFSH